VKLLALLTDAFGGRGGIAKFNRDLLRALCAHPDCEEVVALPRVVGPFDEELPAKLSFRTEAAGGKVRFLTVSLRTLAEKPFDAIVCGHLNLLPLARVLALRGGAPVLQIVHGIEAWDSPSSLIRASLSGVSTVVSVSRFTLDRMKRWAPVAGAQLSVVPNCIDPRAFGAAPPRADLLQKYGLADRTVLLTLGRLSATERYKGFDEVIEVLPLLARTRPDISYLIVGDGDDRQRLEEKASSLGVGDRVVFAGYVAESEKADHYRLGHAFVMPGRGEGYGIAYLEAAASGLPVLGSTLDASGEIITDLQLGEVVDPTDRVALVDAIHRTLAHSRGTVPGRLTECGHEQFTAQWHTVLNCLLTGQTQPVRRAAWSEA